MAQNLGTYDPFLVDCIVADRTLQGYAEGEFIRTERTTEDEFRTMAGAKGDFTFVRNRDLTGRIVVLLKENSQDNVFLQALKEARTIFPVRVVTAGGQYREIAVGLNGMVGVAPRKIFSQDEGIREWVFVVGELIETDKSI